MNWFRRLRTITRKDRIAMELDAEMRFHLEHLVEENIAAGMPPEEARYAARREFGGVEQIKEACRSARGLDWLEGLLQDARHALRGFRRNPAFAVTVVAITAAGIGATTAVFSFADRVLFRGLPYRQPERLVSIGISSSILDFDFMTAAAYRELRRSPAPLESVTSWSRMTDCDLTEHRPLRLACANVEASFLQVLGVEPLLGRSFTPEEDVPGAPQVVVISHALWKSRLGGDAAALGQRISLDGQPALIAGVLPPWFEMPTLDRADLLVPQRLPPNPPPGSRPLRIIGRLPAGMTAAGATAAASPLRRVLDEVPPRFRNEVKLRVRTLRDLQSGDFRRASWVLLAAVLAILLIACANAANLLLARSMSRHPELALRVALGAPRSRVVRQTMAESLLLSVSGGILGCVLARVLLGVFVAIVPAGIPHLSAAALDMRVLLCGLAASVVCGLAVGLAPALRTPGPAVLVNARVAGPSSLLARHVLVAAQLAISLVLLTGAGLLIHSLWNRQAVALGIRTDRVITAQLAPGARYSEPAARLALYEQLESRLQHLPGVEAVAFSDSLPPGGVPRSQPFFALQAEGKPAFEEGTGGTVVWRAVTPDYFRALRIPIVRGRAFTAEDRLPTAQSIILSRSLARRLFPNEDPLGRRMRRFPPPAAARHTGTPRIRETADPWYTVVGVAADARNAGLVDRNDPEYYIARRHAASYDDAPAASALIVRGSANPEALATWVRTEIAAADPVLPAEIRTFEDHVGELAARPRFSAALLAMSAMVALLLAGFGLYGLVSFLVVQRRREIGVRLALGATRAQIGRMVIGHALRWTCGGLLGGAAGAAIAASSVRSLLFHVPAADPAAFAGAGLVLVVVALAAALLPSRRAASLDPMTILRQE